MNPAMSVKLRCPERRSWISLRNPCSSGHLNFTDIAGFIDSLGLQSHYPPNVLGTIPAPAAITATRQLITAYFDYFLKHDKDALTMLNAPSQQNQYLLRLR